MKQGKETYVTFSAGESQNLGKKLAEKITSSFKDLNSNKGAFLIGLEGELGAGKTTFLQGFAKGLGIKERVLSPTFVLMRKFQIPKSKYQINPKIQIPNFKNFHHIDCYRIGKEKELLDLGFREIIENPQNIVVVEWADKIKKILPKNTLWLKFKFLNKNQRKIEIYRKQTFLKTNS